MATSDIIITILVLLGIFLLAYCAIRQKNLLDVVQEIKEIIQGKTEQMGETLKYA